MQEKLSGTLTQKPGAPHNFGSLLVYLKQHLVHLLPIRSLKIHKRSSLLPPFAFLESNVVNCPALSSTGAHPGFPVGGGAKPPGGCQHMILPNFVKNCMKLRKFGPPGEARVQNFTM